MARHSKFRSSVKTLSPKRKRLHISNFQPIETLPEDDSDLHEADSPPLQEAEVFLAFGLAESAEAVVISALKDGTLTQDEVDRFWARPALDRASGD
ncbi:MAG: hypothetical protein WBO95_16185 [Candidatus Dechloromonas phosphoritropha]